LSSGIALKCAKGKVAMLVLMWFLEGRATAQSFFNTTDQSDLHSSRRPTFGKHHVHYAPFGTVWIVWERG
jgi:hypothetical protein